MPNPLSLDWLVAMVNDTEHRGRYSLYSIDQARELVTARQLVGYFEDSDESWRTFSATHCIQSSDPIPDEVDHLEIRILSIGGLVVGAYSVTSVRIAHDDISDGRVLQLSGYLLDLPHPDAPTAWERWGKFPELRPNEWTELATAEREAWLESARLHADWVSSEEAADSSGGAYELDGSNMTDDPGFYCAVGEALRGPGGYFGSTLDALKDCLAGGFGVVPPFALNWHSSSTARTHLGDAFMDEILSTMRSAGVAIALS